MAKSITWMTSILALLVATPAIALTEDRGYCLNSCPNAPKALDLSDYYARYYPDSTSDHFRHSFWLLRRFYLTGRIGKSYTKISDIENESTPTPNAVLPPVATTSVNQTVHNAGIALGYQIRKSGIFSRIEIEYMKRGTIDYNVNPVLVFDPTTFPPTITLQSTIDNQTLFGKIYWDLDLFECSHLVPYIQIGGGASFNKVTSNGTFTLVPNIPNLSTQSSITNSDTNLGGEAGLGARYWVSKHLILDLGYEFDYLGKVQWTINTLNPTVPITLVSNSFYSNTINLGLTLLY